MMQSGAPAGQGWRLKRPQNPFSVQVWRDAFDPLAPHSVLATIAGLAIVAVMVPILLFFHGPEGFLGA